MRRRPVPWRRILGLTALTVGVTGLGLVAGALAVTPGVNGLRTLLPAIPDLPSLSSVASHPIVASAADAIAARIGAVRAVRLDQPASWTGVLAPLGVMALAILAVGRILWRRRSERRAEQAGDPPIVAGAAAREAARRSRTPHTSPRLTPRFAPRLLSRGSGRTDRTPKAVQALAAAGADPAEIAWKTGLPLDAVALLLSIGPASRQLQPPAA